MTTGGIASKGNGATSSSGEVAGFWRRTMAFGIDSLVLGLIGIAVAVMFFDQLETIGHWGRLIGFLIGSAYFAFMEGHGGRCQSLGKQALNIKVVRCTANGIQTLSVAQAWMRYAIVAVPTVLYGIGFVDLPGLQSPEMAWLASANRFVVFVWGAALVYLLAFNRPSRQSLHDLAVSSLVVRAHANEVRAFPVRRQHWVVLGVLTAVLVIASPFVNRFIASKFSDGYGIQTATLAVPGVRESGVTMMHVWRVGASSGRAPSTVTTIAVVGSGPTFQGDTGTLAVAKAAFSASSTLAKQDLVTIICARAVDLGIATWRTQIVDSRSGSQWKLKMESNP